MGRVVIPDGLDWLRKPSSVGLGTGVFGGASTGAAPTRVDDYRRWYNEWSVMG
jgi:hypothetical protein